MSFEVPESDRPARDALRNRIVELLGAPIGGALYVSPHPWEPWIDAVADTHAVADRVTTIIATRLRHRGSADPVTVARSLWPIDDLAIGYRAFLDRWTELPTTIDRATAVRLAFEASGEIEYLLRRDPILPAEMLPSGFAGPGARALYLDTMNVLASDALVAEANIYTTYRTAIDHALTQTADQFWTEAYARTATTTSGSTTSVRDTAHHD